MKTYQPHIVIVGGGAGGQAENINRVLNFTRVL